MADPNWYITGNPEVSTELVMHRDSAGEMVISSHDNRFPAADPKSPIEIARGSVSGAEAWKSYGELETSGAVTNHIVWPVAGEANLVVPSASGVQITLSSDSADDTDGGTGIRSVRMIYLDGSLNEQTETITLNGTTSVTTQATDIRFIQCMHMMTYGSQKQAAGNVSAVHDGTTYSYIKAGQRRCSSSFRRVPAGNILVITSLYGSSISGTSDSIAQIRFVATYLDGQDFTEDGITFPHQSIGIQDGAESVSSLAIAFPEGVIVGFEVTCDKSATINAGFMGHIENG